MIMTSSKWTLILNTDTIAPMLGIGTWLATGDSAKKALEVAVSNGCRSIDCAWVYGNEDTLGEGLSKIFSTGIAQREDLFITSKLWSNYHAPEDVEIGCRETLRALNLDYLDLYLVHEPWSLSRTSSMNLTDADKLGYDADRMARTWEAMEALVAKGLVRDIGISNFSITKTERLLKTAKIVPAVNQVEYHPYLQQVKLAKYCKMKGIVVEAYAPLGSPGRSLEVSGDPVVLDDPVIKEIAAKHSATPGQICISFLLHLGLMVIPKSTNEGRIIENIKAADVTLSPEEVERLKSLDRNHRYFWEDEFYNESHEEAWDIAADEAFKL